MATVEMFIVRRRSDYVDSIFCSDRLPNAHQRTFIIEGKGIELCWTIHARFLLVCWQAG